MARMVIRTAKEPMEIKVGNESKWICMCGLTTNLPYCSGMHRKTETEEDGKTYYYFPDGTRKEVEVPKKD